MPFKKGYIPWNKGLKEIKTNDKGKPAWNKGLFCPQISKIRKGMKFSEEHKENLSKSHKGKFRSEETKEKIRKAFKGERNHQWKGGITPLVIQIRHCFKYRQWRSDIFQRDNFTCVLCRKRGGHLEVDHYPKEFAQIIYEYKIKSLEKALNCEELWNINNGRTLCLKCHNKTK